MCQPRGYRTRARWQPPGAVAVRRAGDLTIAAVDVTELRYALPPAAIAQHPVEPRDSARLLVALGDVVTHATVTDLPGYLRRGDVVVLNTTRVIPARLRLSKRTGGSVEVLLLTPQDDAQRTWEALVRPGKRVPEGTELVDGSGAPAVVVGGVMGADGQRRVTLVAPEPPADMLARLGVLPLPPYIHEELADPERYQTVFGHDPGSVAAPTAGLHLTAELIDRCRHAGATVETVTLDVGLGTFQPITADRVEDHRMHVERYSVPERTLDACGGARRVVAVGTTSLRALESAAASGNASGSTDLFIHGEYDFRVVDVLLTNFHLPGSSLLALLEAFAGSRWRALYSTALESGYRFLSFGDAMLIDRR